MQIAWCVPSKIFPFFISMTYDEYGKGEIWQVREGYDFFSDIDYFLSPSFVGGDMIHIEAEYF